MIRVTQTLPTSTQIYKKKYPDPGTLMENKNTIYPYLWVNELKSCIYLYPRIYQKQSTCTTLVFTTVPLQVLVHPRPTM